MKRREAAYRDAVMMSIDRPKTDLQLGLPVSVLDHGFIRVIDYMGDDSAIVQAARVSYGKGTRKKSDDEGLIRYLMRHWHSTPFEMCEIKFHIKAPIFVARQWLRHRAASVNEYSARYSILNDEFYLPAADQMAAQSGTNAQGRGEVLEGQVRVNAQNIMGIGAAAAYEDYSELLEHGLARELARNVLPVSTYTEWYWKIDLHNLFHFLRLRNDPHAQYEIRAYAEIIDRLVEQWVPLAHAAFQDYRMKAVSFSGREMEVVRDILSGADADDLCERLRAAGASAGEVREFLEKMK